MLELRHAELTADGERDEAQRDLGDQRKTVYVFLRREAEPLNPKQTQAIRSNQNTCDQICRHRRQLQGLGNAGHQKAREDCNRE